MKSGHRLENAQIADIGLHCLGHGMENKNAESYGCIKDDPCYGCKHAVAKMHRTAFSERKLECFKTGELEPCLETLVSCCYEKRGKK